MFKAGIKNSSSVSGDAKKETPQKGIFKKTISILLIIIAIAGIATSFYYYKQYRALKTNPNLEAQKEVQSLVAAVGKLMELPADESPTVATIADKEKLKEQAFFLKAENGDKLLAYTKAMVAILYRPSANKIINVAPIVINQPTQPPAAQGQDVSSAPANPRIAYYNGSKTPGLSGKAEQEVKAAYPDYQTGILDNAKNNDYQDTLVIDLKGSFGKEVEELASLLGGKVASLPAGEDRPEADILIILGQ